MKALIVLGMIFSSPSWATMIVGNPNCPLQFEGKVAEVVDGAGPSSALSTQKVIFSIKEKLKGDMGEKMILDVLANGPFELKRGEDYRVQVRNGKLCWIEHI